MPLLLASIAGGCEDEVAGEGMTDFRLRDVQPMLGDARRDDMAAADMAQAEPGDTSGARPVGGAGLRDLRTLSTLRQEASNPCVAAIS